MDIQSAFSNTFDLLFPRICLVCTRPIAHGALCFRCLPEADPVEHDLSQWPGLPFDSLFSIWSYQHSARRFITAMKYRPSIRLAQIAASELARLIAPFLLQHQVDLILPIPSSRASFRRRLFNPVVPAAQAIAVSLGLPWSVRAVRHRGYEAPQASLSHTRRLSNVRQAFRADRKAVEGRRILLVDDVVTTGSTVAAAAFALRRAGAESVSAAALAQVASWTNNLQALLRLHRF
jgi:ComF family protein